MSSVTFREMAHKAMSNGDAEALEFCTLKPIKEWRTSEAKISSNFVKDWYNWEDVLRLNLAKNRSQKLKRDNSDIRDAPEYPSEAVAAAKTAITMDSPLEAELFLDKARWNAIEMLQGFNYFSENTIYAYLLKLQLMERRQAFNMEEGFAEYKTLYASILESANQGSAGEFE